jgi:hypothetical protein
MMKNFDSEMRNWKRSKRIRSKRRRRKKKMMKWIQKRNHRNRPPSWPMRLLWLWPR